MADDSASATATRDRAARAIVIEFPIITQPVNYGREVTIRARHRQSVVSDTVYVAPQ